MQAAVTKEKLIQIIKRLLNTDESLSFLNQLEETDLKVLTAAIRERTDKSRAYNYKS
jgi:hypothetical protein